MQRDYQHSADDSYPGLERPLEKESAHPLPMVGRTPANSPLAGRHTKPGAAARAGRSGGARTRRRMSLAPSPDPAWPCPAGTAVRAPLASLPRKPAPTAAPQSAVSAGVTMSFGQGAPSVGCVPTLDGPVPKRLRFSFGLQASTATYDSDDSDGEEAVSRRRVTPNKAAPPAAARHALHPPPTWAAGLRASSGGAVLAAAPAPAAGLSWGMHRSVSQVGAGRAGIGGGWWVLVFLLSHAPTFRHSPSHLPPCRRQCGWR